MNDNNVWTCPNPECKHEGNTSNFCPKCGSARPKTTESSSDKKVAKSHQQDNNLSVKKREVTSINHIEFDEEDYHSILKSLNSIDASYKGMITSACSSIESAINSFPDSYSSAGISSIGSSIDGHIGLISSLSEMTNYAVLAYQTCDNSLCEELNKLIDSLFSDNESDKADYYKSIMKIAIEEKDGILKFKENVSDEFKYYSFLSTIHMEYNYSDAFLSSLGGNYGIDQGIFTNLKTKDPKLFQEVKEMLIKEYNFTNNSAEQFFSLVDGIGACTYAAGANALILTFQNKQDEFEKIFGFDYYRETSTGEKTINDVKLLADYYIWANIKGNNDAELLIKDQNGHLVINKEAYTLDDDGGYKSIKQRNAGVYYDNNLSQYLQSKSNGIYNLQVDEVIKSGRDNFSEIKATEIKDKVMSIYASGKQAAMGMCSNTDTILYTSASEKYQLDGSHWIGITGCNDKGIFVSSWGEKFFVSYDDLEGQYFNIYSVDLNND